MNLYFVFNDGSLVTPPLTGTILPGITRDSLLALAREEGLTVREERYSIDSGARMRRPASWSRPLPAHGGRRHTGRQGLQPDGEFTIGSGGPGQLTQKLKARLVAIQPAEAPDTHGWLMKLD